MKKILSLPLLAVMALASQAWAAECMIGTSYAACEYSDPACYSMSPENSNSVTGVCTKPNCTCDQLITACKKDGKLYSFATRPSIWEAAPWGNGKTCSGNGGTLEYSAGCGKWCKWSTGCTEIKMDSEFATCEAAIKNCKDNAPSYSDATCSTFDGGRDPSRTALGCCLWSSTETNCHTIWSDETGAETKVSNCKSGTNKFWNGECTSSGTGCPTSTPVYPASSSSAAASGASSSSVAGGSSSSVVGGSSSSGIGGDSSSSEDDTPIISHNKAPVVGLSVIHFARSLQIASGKDATVALFDMQGKQVFSQKVLSGTTILSLGKQRQGIYYAVVSSGAQKQTVKVVLK
ncbi:MAG: T9SS type A sorting domain-containing protein [Fibromonadaceae bacterium]|jgi:hypothetical protein|nr:T9SS type A sorting domain-containing protein [Fibromonadaceae bacterium]